MAPQKTVTLIPEAVRNSDYKHTRNLTLTLGSVDRNHRTRRPQSMPSGSELTKKSNSCIARNNTSTSDYTIYIWKVHINITVCGSIYKNT